MKTNEELARLVIKTAQELGVEEKTHPQLMVGEVYLGNIEYTKGRDGKLHESYTSSFIPDRIDLLKTVRLGTGEDPIEDHPLYDYSRPVFMEESEWQAYLSTLR
jgi:hypothetical protein